MLSSWWRWRNKSTSLCIGDPFSIGRHRVFNTSAVGLTSQGARFYQTRSYASWQNTYFCIVILSTIAILLATNTLATLGKIDHILYIIMVAMTITIGKANCSPTYQNTFRNNCRALIFGCLFFHIVSKCGRWLGKEPWRTESNFPSYLKTINLYPGDSRLCEI